MDDRFEPMDELDALIDQALSDEPFLRAPVSLQRGIEARLKLAALRDQEQSRFRFSMASLVFVFIASLAMAGILLWFTNLSALYTDGVSGGKGHLDFYTTSLSLSFTAYQGAYSLIASLVLAIGAIALAVALQVHKLMYSD